ncbi:MAG: 1,6-anhydro-N-acetylmuramyl-L-alanine amidase AmpD [Pseudomonadota bacterium]
MRIGASGVVEGARFIASPNCDERPEGCAISLLVIHNISLPPREYGGEGVIELFTNRLDPQAHPYYRDIAHLKVSAHFLIRRGGEIVQFVSCRRRAWHAGVSEWRGRARCNDFSIGIELEGCDVEPFTDIQYERLAELTRALQAVYPIEDIVGHADIAPGRKTDPGPFFDWERFRNRLA